MSLIPFDGPEGTGVRKRRRRDALFGQMEAGKPVCPCETSSAVSLTRRRAAGETELWERVDAIVAQAPGVSALTHHGLELLAARRQRRLGLGVHPDLPAMEKVAAIKAIATPYVLNRVRAAVNGPLVLMKGPEAAASYPWPECRPFKDLDVLTLDAEAAYVALLKAGFVETGSGGAAHHMPPLGWPGVPLVVELHWAPSYVDGLPVPGLYSLLHLTRPSRTGIAGIAGFSAAAHAVLLAVHAWFHAPLQRLGPLIDVAAVLEECNRAEANELACSWGCPRLWRATTTCIDALLGQRAAPISMRVLARHLATTREPRVLEAYQARLASPVWALPRASVARGIGTQLTRTVRPDPQESWAGKLTRSRRALARTFRPLSEYRT